MEHSIEPLFTWARQNEKRQGDDSNRCPAKCKSCFRIFAIFVEQTTTRKTKRRKKKKRERIVVGAGRWCLPGRRDITEQRCTHIVAKLARYCFMLQNIAFYLRAAASHVENSLVRGITCLSCHPSYIEQG